MDTRIDLDGTWQLRWNDFHRGGTVGRVQHGTDLDRALPATVPGEVHLDLMAAGIIDEPAVGLNVLRSRWVEEFMWYYRRQFEAAALPEGGRAFLVFECLDLVANIYLNGRKVGSHANAFCPARVEVTKELAAGTNTLVVELDAGLYSVAEKPIDALKEKPDAYLHKRNWLRTTQSTFGWDWSQRLLNVGIRGHVYLEVSSAVHFDRLVALATVSDDLATGKATARMFVEGLDDKTRAGTLELELEAPGGKASVVARATAQVEIKPGRQSVQVEAALDRPELWWPVGHGGQPLYTLKARLTIDGKVVAADSRRVGFRHVRVNQDKHPASGTWFVLEVNHKSIFAKGGNFVPADPIMARIDRARYETLVDRALEANFNLLRVWGGGLYEAEEFYDICDERGVLVWQEFIFACARYPGYDDIFFYNVRDEAVHQVRRLASHASLMLWCGNNELELLTLNPEHQKGVSALGDYGIYHRLLPGIVKAEDGTRYYHPSSPYSADYVDQNRYDTGDQHPWAIGFSDNDFRKYRDMDCRFPNEGGILGPTSLPTMQAALAGQSVGSFSWEIHDNNVNYWGDKESYADAMLGQWVGKDIRELDLTGYAYWAGLVQGAGLGEYIRNFRRRMFDSSSAIFWMYNDCWPMTRSWTIVDYFLRRTPSFCPVRRAMAPLAVFLDSKDGTVSVTAANEGPACKARLRYGLAALAGGLPMDKTCEVEIPANAAAVVATFPATQWQSLGEDSHVAFAVLSDAKGGEIGRDVLVMPFYKDMKWNRPKVQVRREGGKAIFTCDSFAFRVCIDLDGEKALPDNFFDILPGIPTVLDWPEALGEPKVLFTGNL